MVIIKAIILYIDIKYQMPFFDIFVVVITALTRECTNATMDLSPFLNSFLWKPYKVQNSYQT